MKIALDAAGGDLGVAPNVEGAVRAHKELGISVVLVGPEREIRYELNRHQANPSDSGLEIMDAPQRIGMGEDPVRACREKTDSSIVRATRLVAEKRADAMVSAGHSGAIMVASLWNLKRLPGVLRPAISAPFPTLRGTSILLDAGANADCKPWHLLQFAVMGALYAKNVFGIEKPRVGLLSNGEEESKGNDLVREAIPLLKHAGLNFIGPVEGRDLPRGAADVIVCDGFVGNVVLKTTEGVAAAIFELIVAEVKANPIWKLGALLMKGGFKKIKQRMSDEEYGGAPLLGVGGTVIVSHGKSTGRAIFNALRVARELVVSDTNSKIRASLAQIKSNMEVSRVLD